MPMSWSRCIPRSPLPGAALGLLLAFSGPAFAGHLVTFRSGATLEIEGFRMEREVVIFSLPGGGEIGCGTGQISRIDPRPLSAQPSAPSAASASPSSVLPPGSPSPSLAPTEKPHVSPFDPEPGVRALIQRIAPLWGVDPGLVEALVRVESNYDPFAVSPKGAMGLMQLMPRTAARFHVTDAFDPLQNLEGGTRYLSELLTRYGEVRLALAAYNAGEEAVDRYQGMPPYRETRQYVGRILERLRP